MAVTPGSAAHRGKAATQQRILRAAGALFVERGYERTTIAMVAKQAGVSRATVFWHFSDKAGLFREAFGALLVPFRESLSRDLGGLAADKQIEQRVAAYLDFVQRNRAIVQGFVALAIESPSLRNEVLQALMQLHHRFTAVLASNLESVLPAGHEPQAVAAGIVAMLHGNLLLGLFDSGDPAAEARRTSAAAVMSLIPRR